MAKKLQQYTFAKPGRKPSQFPWDDWFDGSIWELMKDKDFTLKTQSMKSRANKEAKERGLTLEIDALENRVVLRATKVEVVAETEDN